MRALMDKRQKFIDKCVAGEEKLKEEEQINKAATVIQSIWRGHMVRQQLGKYKGLRKRLKKRKKLSQRGKARWKEKNKEYVWEKESFSAWTNDKEFDILLLQRVTVFFTR